jgi:hypothetical protein
LSERFEGIVRERGIGGHDLQRVVYTAVHDRDSGQVVHDVGVAQLDQAFGKGKIGESPEIM